MLFSPRIRLKALAALCRRVGTCLEAGVDVRTIWRREAERATGSSRAVLQSISDSVTAGNSLTDSITREGDYFPPLLREMVAVGEMSGKADRVFLRLADHYEHVGRLTRIFLIGIAWPAIQLTAAAAIIGLVIWVMGIVQGNAREPVDILGLGLIGTPGLLIYVAGLTAVVMSVVVLVQWLRSNRAIAARVMTALNSVPALGYALRTTALARIAWALSITMDTGMDVRRAVRAALVASGNAQFAALSDKIEAHLTRGSTMHAALAGTGAFPTEFLDSIAIGEETGKLVESLERLSVQYEQRTKVAAAALAAAATFAVWGLVATVIIFFIFRIAMFYINTLNDLSGGF